MLKNILLVILCSLFIIPQSVFSAELTDFVPADAGFFIRLNIKQIISNPDVKAKYEEFLTNPKLKNYSEKIKDMGFDPFNDLYNLTFFMPYESLKADKIINSPFAFIIEGKFDTKKLFEAMKKVSSEINKDRPNVKYSFSEEDGIPTISYADENGKKAKSFLFDNSFMVFGTESGAMAAKAVKMGKSSSIKTNKDFVAVLDRLKKDSNFTFVAKINDEGRQAISNVEKFKPLETVQFVSVDFYKESDLLVKLNGYFSDPVDMGAVSKLMDTFVETGKKTKFPFNAFVDFIENSKFSYEGKIATIDSKITPESIKEIIDLITNKKPKTEQKE